MPVNYELFLTQPWNVHGVVVEPAIGDSSWNCEGCGKGIGLSWKNGVSPGLVAICPHCRRYNEFVRVDV